MAFLDRQDGTHAGHTNDASSIESSSDSHPRRRRRLHTSDRSTRSSSSSTNDRPPRRSSHKRRQPSSPRTPRSPKQNHSTSFKPLANASDETRSFLPSLSRILESSPGIGAGRWDTSSMPEAPCLPSTRQQECSQGSHRTAQRRHTKSRLRGLTSPSTNSILSTMTARTGSSSGSGSTVTQRSYESTRSQKTKAAVSGSPNLERQINLPTLRYDRDQHRSPEKLNVFKFMIQDEADEDRSHDIDEPLWQSDSSTSSDDDNLRPQRPFTPTSSATRDSSESPSMSYKQIRAASHVAGSLHSDSGISVQGSSSDCSDRADKPLIDPLALGAAAETHQPATAHPSTYTALHAWQQRRSSNASDYSGYQYAPQYHQAMPSMSSMVPYRQAQRDDRLPPEATKTSAQSTPASSNPSGYDLLASELTSASSRPAPDGIVPLYRKFERLNHRILLHLQDEICEMEEQLEQLDKFIAGNSEHGNPPQPASRRRECRHGNEHEVQRTELLGRIFLKMKQYNKAISGHSSMGKAGPPATTQEVETYRSRMKDTRLVAEEETRFLDHDNDLVRLPGRHLQNPKPEASSSSIMMVGLCMSFFFGASLSLNHFWLAFSLCVVGLAWVVRSGFDLHSKLAA